MAYKKHIDGLNFLPFLTVKTDKGPCNNFFYIGDGGERKEGHLLKGRKRERGKKVKSSFDFYNIPTKVKRRLDAYYKESAANRVSFLIDKKGTVRFKQEATIMKPRDIKEMIRKVKDVRNE